MTVRPTLTDPVFRLNSCCPYYTMFPLTFPWQVLSRARSDAVVLDPFCGRGTTNFAARLRGVRSVGIDTNPVAVAIARAKFNGVRASRVVERCAELLEEHSDPTMPEGAFWRLCFHNNTLRSICSLREHFVKQPVTKTDQTLLALVLGILHGPLTKGSPTYLSNQMPRTFATKPTSAIRYWRDFGLAAPKVDLMDAVSRRASYVLTEIPAVVKGRAILGDVLEVELTPKMFTHIITSPPYYGMYTYYPDQWLRAWFLGGPASPSQATVAQIGKGSRETFATNLAKAWTRVAAWSKPRARLVIRFGSLPSAGTDPESLLTRSIELSNAGWNVTRIASAGSSTRGKRQATQFNSTLGGTVEEIDLYAVLDG
jgi:SAM-dependent methyltransferase